MGFERSRTAIFRSQTPFNEPEFPICDPDGHSGNPAAQIRSPTP